MPGAKRGKETGKQRKKGGPGTSSAGQYGQAGTEEAGPLLSCHGGAKGAQGKKPGGPASRPASFATHGGERGVTSPLILGSSSVFSIFGQPGQLQTPPTL